MDHPFRSAALGGFHRQDVLDYLETTAQEHGRQVESLNDRLSQMEGQLTRSQAREQELEGQLAALRQEAEAAQSQLHAARNRGEDLEYQLEQSRTRRDEKSREADQLRDRVKELEDVAAALRPDAQAYLTLRDRTAGVELDAHRRAQLTMDEAQTQADHLKNQMQLWLGRISREYGQLRSRIDATICHTVQELGNVERTLGEISVLMEQQDLDLDELGQAYAAETGREKVPAPMPLKEKE